MIASSGGIWMGYLHGGEWANWHTADTVVDLARIRMGLPRFVTSS
jgi:hypothetical protein